jgi:hypothetical protein
MDYIGKGHTNGKCQCGHYHPRPNMDGNGFAKTANEIADMIQIIDLSDAEYQDWHLLTRAMPAATFERKMDDA